MSSAKDVVEVVVEVDEASEVLVEVKSRCQDLQTPAVLFDHQTALVGISRARIAAYSAREPI